MPKARATPAKPMPRAGYAAASTAAPQPPSTSQNVPRHSAARARVSVMPSPPICALRRPAVTASGAWGTLGELQDPAIGPRSHELMVEWQSPAQDDHASPLPDANGRRKKVTGHPPAAWSRVMPRLQGWFLQQPHDALAWPEPRETPRGE